MVTQVTPLHQQISKTRSHRSNSASYYFDNKIYPSSGSLDFSSDFNSRSNTYITSTTASEPNEHPPTNYFQSNTENSSSHASLSLQSDGISTISSTFDDLFGYSEGKKGKMKRFFKECCPAPHTLQNILLVVFLLQTAICIGKLTVFNNIYVNNYSS